MPGSGSLRGGGLKPVPHRIVPAPRNDLPAPAAGNVVPVPRTVAPVPRNNFPARISPFAPRATVVPRSSQPNAPLAAMTRSLTRQKVQPGDSWWRLASRYLGKGSRWEELLRVNPGLSRDPERLPAGTYIFVPGNVRAKTPAPRGPIVVERGDTLWSLAREYLGSGPLWRQLAATNPEITQFTRLKIGTKLKLPDSATPAGPVPDNADTR